MKHPYHLVVLLIEISLCFRVIRLCLSIWNRSPEAFKELRESGMLKLPSCRLLQMYKNSCSQNPGFNESVGKWMSEEALKRKIGPKGREEGIILDEMVIQVTNFFVFNRRWLLTIPTLSFL